MGTTIYISALEKTIRLTAIGAYASAPTRPISVPKKGIASETTNAMRPHPTEAPIHVIQCVLVLLCKCSVSRRILTKMYLAASYRVKQSSAEVGSGTYVLAEGGADPQAGNGDPVGDLLD